MGKHKLKTKTQILKEEKFFKIQKFEQPQGEEKRFIKITHYMLCHKSFIELSSNAKIALIYIKDWAMVSKSYLETGKFEYSSSMISSKRIMSQKTAVKALNELVEKGFLKREYKHGAGAINRFSFSNRWYTGKEDAGVDIDDYKSIKQTREW